MDSLDVNDTCKRPITNLKRHFCQDILNIFQKGLIFGLDDYQFGECRFTQKCCAKG